VHRAPAGLQAEGVVESQYLQGLQRVVASKLLAQVCRASCWADDLSMARCTPV